MKPNDQSSSIGITAVDPVAAAAFAHGQNPMPSCDEMTTRKAIVDFVESATKRDPSHFVPASVRQIEYLVTYD